MRLIDADSFKTDLMASAIDAKEDFIREKDWRFCVEVTKNFLRDIDERPTIDPADILAGMWVPVSERLPEPEDGDWVLGIATADMGRLRLRNAIALVGYDPKEGWFLHERPTVDATVTHWMPLPQPPKEDKP